jgi:hypothetical protein
MPPRLGVGISQYQYWTFFMVGIVKRDWLVA